MLKIDDNGTHLEIIPPDMHLFTKGSRWFVRVPANATQVCEVMDVDPVEDVDGKVLDAIIQWALAITE